MNTCRNICFVAIAAIFIALPISGSERNRSLMQAKAKEKVCLGRYLLEVPSGTEVVGRFKYMDNDIEVVRGESTSVYLKRLQSKEDELKKALHSRGGTMFVESRNFGPGQTELVSWTSDASRILHHYELFSHFEQPAITLTMSTDGSASRFEEIKAYSRELAGSIRYRGDKEMPAAPGFCIEAGFLKGAELNAEEVAVGLDVPGYPTVTLSYDSYVTGNPDRPLLSRVPLVPAMLVSLLDGTSTLRRRDRNIGPIKGQELLVRANENGKRSYEFLWESQGQADSIEFPFMSLQLSTSAESDDNGEVIDAPFANDEEALAFWDAILGSIRLRPGAVGSTSN